MKKRIGFTLGALALAATTAFAVAGQGYGGCGGPGAGMDGYAAGMMGGQGGSGMHGMMGEKSGPGMHGIMGGKGGPGMQGMMGDHGQAMGRRMLERLDWALELSPEQRVEVRELLKEHQATHAEHRAEMLDLHGKVHDLDPSASDYAQKVEQLADQHGDAMTQMLMARGELHNALSGLLTEQQRQTWQQMGRGPGSHHGGGSM